MNKFIFSLLVLILAGCGANQTTNPIVESNTPATPELTWNFISEDGALTFDYPEGWTVQGNSSQVVISNGQSVMPTGASGPASGQFFASIVVAPTTDTPGLSAGANALQVLGVYSEFFAADSEGAAFGEASTLDFNGKSAARAENIGSSNSQSALFAVDLGNDVFAVAVAAAAPGELANYEATMRTILASMLYTAAG
jgi:hypothetical protein